MSTVNAAFSPAVRIPGKRVCNRFVTIALRRVAHFPLCSYITLYMAIIETFSECSVYIILHISAYFYGQMV